MMTRKKLLSSTRRRSAGLARKTQWSRTEVIGLNKWSTAYIEDSANSDVMGILDACTGTVIAGLLILNHSRHATPQR